MTLAELNRVLDSKRRVEITNQQKKAAFDYALADLIGRSVARVHSSANKLPTLEEAYPTLFVTNDEEAAAKAQAKRDELSSIRFKQFAQFHNKKIEEVRKVNE